MSTTVHNIKLGLGYEGTDFERKLTLNGVDSLSADIETVRTKVQAVNASLSGGTSDGLDTFFRSDDYNSSENVGAFKEITSCIVNREEITDLI